MAIEHKNIPEEGLHEPKGVSTAPSNRVYRSNGAGSGSWDQVDADTLAGLVNNATDAGLRLITDGSGGFTTEEVFEPAYGVMVLTGNATATSVTAASDSTLGDDADYVEITTSTGFPVTRNFVTGTNYLEVVTAGDYLIDFWANAYASTNGVTMAIKFGINGTDLVDRRPKLQLPNANDRANLSGNGIHTFAVGDRVSLFIAATANTDITLEDMAFQMNLVGV